MKKPILLFAALLATTLLTAQTAFVTEPARTADEFIESIGVAVHWGYRNTVYGQKFPELRQLIGDLGIRHTRTGWNPRIAELYNDFGIRSIIVAGPDNSMNADEEKWWADKLDTWAANRDAITYIEGPNEVNGWANYGITYQGKTWPEGPRNFQAELYKRVKGDPRTADIPVIALSLAYRGAGPVIAPVEGYDFANAHNYAGGGQPGNAVELIDHHLMFGRGTEIKPTVVTESGYHTCVPHDTVIAGNQQGVSREAHRKYIPRHAATYFNAGYAHTVIYEFAAGRPNKKENEDPEAAFGLLDPDGLPKPAYFAMKNLFAALNEPDREKARNHQPGVLTFALDNVLPTLRHTLLQKADGAFVLLLWNEVSSFDLRTKKDIATQPLDITLRLQTPASSATVIASLGGKDNAPATKLAGPVDKIALKISDEITVVELAPPAAGWPAGALPAPVDINVELAPTSVTLSGPAASDETVWVSGYGQKTKAKKSADGKTWGVTFNGLIPDRIYSFELVAVTPAGKRSAPARVKAHTLPHFPDLIVREIHILDEKNARIEKIDEIPPGTKVGFGAVIANIGDAPTPDGVTIGVKFGVNGRTVAWHDATKKSLPAGEELTITANSGPGTRHWTVVPGMHKLLAHVDDVNRIMESNENNNTMTIAFGTGKAPDLIISVASYDFESPKKTINVVVENIGEADVADGSVISTTAFDRPAPPRKGFGYATVRAGIPVGGKIEMTIPVTNLPDPLPPRFCVVVDDAGRITESDKTNNSALVFPKPPRRARPPLPEVTVKPDGKPDLIIFVADVDLEGTPKTIDVEISNIGTAHVPAGATISATAYDRATPPRKNFGYTTNRDGLPAGKTLSLTIPLGNLPANLPETFCVVVDDANRIEELDKTNNSALVYPKP